MNVYTFNMHFMPTVDAPLFLAQKISKYVERGKEAAKVIVRVVEGVGQVGCLPHPF